MKMSEHPLWSVSNEKKILTYEMFATISCLSCDYIQRAFFRDKSKKCPKCGINALRVDSFNQRNAIVANETERFATSLIESAIDSSPELTGKFYVKRNVQCPKLGLTKASAADVAILNQNVIGPVKPDLIECIFEVKMSVIWNWTEDDLSRPIADYDRHAGRPSIYRTDSILKAIGKAAITRSCPDSERIPFIVLGNTPPPFNYREKVDVTVKSGLIQKWLSVTPNPLMVDPSDSSNKRNPKETTGFLRIDTVEELQKLLLDILTLKWIYMGAMVDPKKVGDIIKSLDLSRSSEEIGYEFIKRLPDASTISDI